jgi:hypothetical protein
LAGKIDAILKISIVASVLFASSSVGYYYLSYLPRRDARLEPERALEQLRTAAQKACRARAIAFGTTSLGTTSVGTASGGATAITGER